MMVDGKKQRKVVFLHPDLGIGGAERLVVDAAVGFQARGHRVIVYTSYCDPKHCFDEARDGTLEVRVRGDWLIPPSLLGRFAILCAILRQLHLIVSSTVELRSFAPDSLFVDQLSAGLPILKYFLPHTPIFFYCHFPDLLLAQDRTRWWKRVYRLPFDALEQWSIGFADAIAVNSAFTRGIVKATWPRLAKTRDLKVVYPCIKVQSQHDEALEGLPWKGKRIALSINRFERKKNVALAIRAFAGLARDKRTDARLVVAGGYDSRVSENVLHHNELVALAESLSLRTATAKTVITALGTPADVDVLFLLSVPAALKSMLLRSARLLVYTPANEHFGIVPLEAMLHGVPVLAANSGGPTETVIEGQTGWLRDPEDAKQWTAIMDHVLNALSAKDLAAMSKAGTERVKDNFDDAQMAERLEAILDQMKSAPGPPLGGFLALMLVGVVAMIAIVWSMVAGRYVR